MKARSRIRLTSTKKSSRRRARTNSRGEDIV